MQADTSFGPEIRPITDSFLVGVCVPTGRTVAGICRIGGFDAPGTPTRSRWTVRLRFVPKPPFLGTRFLARTHYFRTDQLVLPVGTLL